MIYEYVVTRLEFLGTEQMLEQKTMHHFQQFNNHDCALYRDNVYT